MSQKKVLVLEKRIQTYYNILFKCPASSDEINFRCFALSIYGAIYTNMFELWSKINVRMVVSNTDKSI